MAEDVSADIFADPSRYDYLVHQCNCLTVKSHGFSELVAQHFGQDADIYATRTLAPRAKNLAMIEGRGFPGTVTVLEPAGTRVKIVALFGQWAPGSLISPWPSQYPKFRRNTEETAQKREHWFKMALFDLEYHIPDGARLAFPWQIGCGLAGGDWVTYREMIDAFATRIKPRGCIVFIYYKK